MRVAYILTVLFLLTGITLSKEVTQNSTDNNGTFPLNFSIPEYIVGIESIKPTKKIIVCTGTLINPTFVLSSAYCVSRFAHNKVLQSILTVDRFQPRLVITVKYLF